MVNDCNPQIFACSRCPGSDFPPSSLCEQLLHHFSTVHSFNELGAQCYLCKTITNCVSELKSHISDCHWNEFQKFRCDFCKFGTSKKQYLKNHNVSKHSQVPHFSCNYCNKNCFTQADLEFHVKKMHMKQKYEKEVSCPCCRKLFKSLPLLCQHLKNEHKPNDEPETGTENVSEDKKEFISRQKSGDLFKCSICALECKSSYRLLDHYNEVHIGLRPFICDGCGISFSRKSNMTKHKRKGACKGLDDSKETGNGSAPSSAENFDCQKCGKTFKYKQSYHQHMERIHMGKKDNQCDECGQMFTQVHHLRRHRVKVHNQGMYSSN